MTGNPTTNGRKVVLMYHSVHAPGVEAVIGSKPISLDRFAHQVESAQRAGWCFGRLSQLHEPTSRDTLFITGDDGTIDWAKTVLPWCDRRGIATHTALLSGPWLNQPVYPLAHVIQVLLAVRPVEQLTDMRQAAEARLTNEQRAYAERIYAYEQDANRRIIKGACSLVLDESDSWRIIGQLSAQERRYLDGRFAPPQTYHRFTFAEFGVHTVSHNALGWDVEAYLAEEIEPCRAHLEQAGLTDSRVFTLPMAPRHGTKAEDLIGTLRRVGYRGMLHAGGQWDGESFIIPRIDAKYVERDLDLPTFQETRAEAA